MASRETLNADKLEALGATRLAALLLEIAERDEAVKRRLRLAIAGGAGPEEAARAITKRLTSIAKAGSFIDWRKAEQLAAELEGLRKAILDGVAPAQPREAFDLAWRLIGLANPVLGRSDDSNGRLSGVFVETVCALASLGQAAQLKPAMLADQAFEALKDDGYGVLDALVAILAPQLGAAGLAQLRQRVEAWEAEPVVIPPEHERRVIGWGSGGKLYADEAEHGHRRYAAKAILREIATATGDVDAYIAQFDPVALTAPAVAADIARRLLDVGRVHEAWDVVEAASADQRGRRSFEWEEARIDILEALGRVEEAQAFRWQCFLDALDLRHLRAYLRRLPDFEDFEAEQRALAHALTFGDVHEALAFLVAWPDRERASRLVLARARELDGNRYELLSPAADMLDEKYPLAATLAHRAMIDFTLRKARSSRYHHAARHLTDCASLSRRIADFAEWPDHASYVGALRAAHGRKAGFWQQVDSI